MFINVKKTSLKMLLKYITLIVLNVQLAFTAQEWIDPHDMNVKRQPIITNDPQVEYHKPDCAVPINFSMSHYKRLINLILSAAVADPNNIYSGRLHIHMPAESYDFLKRFASDSINTEDSALLRQIDQILSRSLKQPIHEQIIEALTSWTDRIYFTFYNRTAMIFSACLFVLFISYKLLRANLTIWSVVKYLIFLAWVADFAFTWIDLLQEAEINKMADSLRYETMPAWCNPNTMTTWQYLMYKISTTDDCRKYHQTLLKDHFWGIAPVTVLSHQLGILIYTPASHIGQAVGSFSSGLLGSLPWGVNIILLPVLLIFSAVMVCIFLSFVTQTSFGFNFLHVLQLQFGNEQRRNIGDVLTGRNLEAVLHLAQRNMIEDVRPSTVAETCVKAEASACSETLTITDKTDCDGEKPKALKLDDCEIKREDSSQKEAVHDGSGDAT